MRTLTSKGKLKVTPGLPIGAVAPFHGTILPTGWSLCDGTGGTPDLRDRFLIGHGSAGSGTASGSVSPATGATHASMAVANHSNHVVTQPAAHPAHVVTQNAAHSNHVVTQPADHGTHASGGAHTHDSHTGAALTAAGVNTDVSTPTTHASQGAHTHDAHSAHASAAVTAHGAHKGLSVDEGTNLYTGDQTDFETGVGGWTSVPAATLTSSTDQALVGTHSLKCVALSAGTQGTYGPKVAATVGTVYSARIPSRAATVARIVQAFLLFYDGGGTLLGTSYSSGGELNSTSAWVTDAISGAAPASTATVQAALVVYNVAIGESHYLDAVTVAVPAVHSAHDAAVDAHSVHSVTQPSGHSTLKLYLLAFIMRTS